MYHINAHDRIDAELMCLSGFMMPEALMLILRGCPNYAAATTGGAQQSNLTDSPGLTNPVFTNLQCQHFTFDVG